MAIRRLPGLPEAKLSCSQFRFRLTAFADRVGILQMDHNILAITLIDGAFSTQNAVSIICVVGVIAAVYLIYRTSLERVHSKTREAEAIAKLHLATAEALATAIDAQDRSVRLLWRRAGTRRHPVFLLRVPYPHARRAVTFGGTGPR